MQENLEQICNPVRDEGKNRELDVEKIIKKMEDDWASVEMKISKWRDTGIYIMDSGSIQLIRNLLEDQTIKMKIMKSSPSIKMFEEKISKWEKWLMDTNDLTEHCVNVQSVLLYLELVFSSTDIKEQLTVETADFQKFGRDWMTMMTKIYKDPKVMNSFTRERSFLETLKEGLNTLDRVQKAVRDYLEQKREVFPRFYFLSNDELLEILSVAKDPSKVQPHLDKCFEGIERLKFDEEGKIDGMYSSDNEYVKFLTKIDVKAAKGRAELWLSLVENAMVQSVRDATAKALEDQPKIKRAEWIKNRCGMAVLCTAMTVWTSNTQVAISEGPEFMRMYVNELSLRLCDLSNLALSDLSFLDRRTVESLIIGDVHNRDIGEQMMYKNVSEISDFDWKSSLRSYWESNNIEIRITNTSLQYNYEYLGNSARLVITPLTDRVYISLATAVKQNYGGSLEGPAGSGKTETVKDLAKTLARQCVVFNCSDQLDYVMIGKFFKGLASVGAWSCFDQFNRIDIEVLAVVAQQILTITMAKKENRQRFIFEGVEISLKPTFNVFITMNPGYAGRSQIPTCLKAFFRSVAMMIPDYTLIAVVLLYSYGFKDAKNLARKIINNNRLCSQHLSFQDHYDFGMRAIHSVVKTSSNLRLKYPNEKQSTLVLRAIKNVNLAKMVGSDRLLFEGVISDLFPGEVTPETDDKDLMECIGIKLKEMNLQSTEYLIRKIIQFYETTLIRHGLMVLGQPFAGKSTIIKVLAEALTLLKDRGLANQNKVQMTVINPKAITVDQLYGVFDPIFQEWNDGVLTSKFKEFAQSDNPNRKWLIFDGPIDAIWVEGMNTLLDDNKKLCLNSGEVIKMSKTMNIIFEDRNCAVVSPATVSRCGMVFLEPKALGWKVLLESWLNKLPTYLSQDEKIYVRDLILWVGDYLLCFIRKNIQESSPTQDQNLIQSLLRIFKILLKEFENRDFNAAYTDSKTRIQVIDGKFTFSLIWSFGASATTSNRKGIEKEIRRVLSGNQPIEGHLKRKLCLPEGHSLFDYNFTTRKSVKLGSAYEWVLWTDYIDTKEKIPKNSFPQDIIVETNDTVRYSYLLDLYVKNRIPLLFCGPTGTGKSSTIKRYISSELPTQEYASIQLCFSARTSSKLTQQIIEEKLQKMRKGLYGPWPQNNCVIFVDELNLAVKDAYGSEPPIELLRQYLDYGGWYDLEDNNKSFKKIINTTLLASMGLPGKNRTFISPRFLGQMSLTSLTSFEDETLNCIYSTILNWFFTTSNFNAEVSKTESKIISSTLQIYNAAADQFLPNIYKPHYIFNVRDVSKVINGICMADKEKVQNQEQIVRLWFHETLRTFSDRLINDEDRLHLFNIAKNTVKNIWQVNFDQVFKHLDKPIENNKDGKIDTLEEIKGLMWTDSMSAQGGKVYEEVFDQIGLQKVIQESLIQYNQTLDQPLNLTLFPFAIEHLMNISRTIRQPRGNACLVGVEGSGRKSLTRLASHLCEHDIYQIKITSNYGRVHWREDLKKVLKQSVEKSTVFLLTDNEVKNESFLEDINGILSSYEVPNLFTCEQKEELMKLMKNLAKSEGKLKDGTSEELYHYFVDKCKKNLHIVLCLSPIGDAFRNRIDNFPSIVNCCTIDWFQEWPQDALMCQARKSLDSVEMEENDKENCCEMMQFLHSSAIKWSKDLFRELNIHNYVTPTSFIELISTFKRILAEKSEKIQGDIFKYEKRSEKIREAAETVQKMRNSLIEVQEKLKQTKVPQIVDRCERQMERTVKLVESLRKEKLRWDELADNLKNSSKNITGDVLISSAEIAYLGVFPTEFRIKIINEWIAESKRKQINYSENFSLVKVLGDLVETQQWNSDGFTSDNFSIKNAIIMKYSGRWPLYIDPQGQANKLIKKMGASKELHIIQQSNEDFLRTLQNAVQFGQSVLLEDVREKLDPVLTPLLLKQTYMKDGKNYLKLGDQIIEYSSSFKFYITTKEKNPHYLPEILSKVTLINATTTFESVNNQLLDIIVSMERPQLREEKDKLAKERIIKQNVENQILNLLSTAKGNILEDENLIKMLKNSMEIDQEVKQKQKMAEFSEKIVKETLMKFQSVSQNISCVFEAVSDLKNVNHMYQYSFESFVKLLIESIKTSEPSLDLSIRLKNIENHFLQILTCNISRSLFQKDKLLFPFLLCIRLKELKGQITSDELRFLLTGGNTLSNLLHEKPQNAQWMSQKSWGELSRLSQMNRFDFIAKSFIDNIENWKEVYDSDEPQREKLPAGIDEKLTPLGKLLILRAIRPDCMIKAIQNYLAQEFGEKLVCPTPFDISKIFEESSSTSPIIFIMSSDSDPFADVSSLAESKKKNVKTVSLGQGMGSVAKKMIQERQKKGEWVVIHNCHLSNSWMPTLEIICDQMSSHPEKINPDFRLWLTTQSSSCFPSVVLQSSLKISIEVPSSLKETMKKVYQSGLFFTSDCSKDIKSPSQVFNALTYALSFFHAVIRERQNYGPLGWNNPYSFNKYDFYVSVQHLKEYREENEKIPFRALNYLIAECNYGGRIKDDNDRRLMSNLISDYFSENSLKQNFSFGSDDAFKLPKLNSHQEYLQHIQSLPHFVHPNVIGLHSNAEITRNIKEVKGIFQSALLCFSKISCQTFQSSLEKIIEKILEEIPQALDIETAMKKYPISYVESLNGVLTQELVRFNRLLETIKSNLKGIKLSLQGKIVLNPSILEVAHSLVKDKVPDLWLKKSYPSLKPLGSYLEDLKERVTFFQNWIEFGQPTVFWISSFFSIQSFINGILQNFVRKYAIPVNEVVFNFYFLKDKPEVKPEDGAYIEGLFLEGCRWNYDWMGLDESEPKKLYTQCPIILLQPVQISKQANVSSNFVCPVYKTSIRRGVLSSTGHSTNFCMYISMPSMAASSHWIKRGAALLTQLDD